MKIIIPTLAILLFCTQVIFFVTPLMAAEQGAVPIPYKIGVLAYKGKKQAMQRWTAHGDYLNRRLAPLKFEIIPLTYKQDELSIAVINRKLDFVITNPGHYTELELGGHVSRLATRRMSGPEGVLDQFGGTVIALPQRSDLNTYADLAGKKILIPSQSSLGGWQVHLREALSQGVDLRTNAVISEIKDHRKVVEGILAGKADVGFVRSDLLEEMAADGQINLDQVKVLNQRLEAEYPYLLSTRLYPEWPFAKVHDTSSELSMKVLKALLEIQPEYEVAKSAGIYGWTIPGHYSAVSDLFREARLGPYASQEMTHKQIIETYWLELLLLLSGVLLILLISTLRAFSANRALRLEINERQRVENQNRLFSLVVEQSPVSVMITDNQGVIEFVNSRFENITGYCKSEVLGSKPSILKSGRMPQNLYSEMWHKITNGQSWDGEIENRRKNGELFWEHEYIAPVTDEKGQTTHFLSLKEDITPRKEQEEMILYQAHYDALTKLPNRFLSLDRLSQLLNEAQRTGDRVGIMFLDLDDFKKINDSLGHEMGDKVLIQAAERLNNNLRDVDTIGRLGGDEFIIQLGGLKDPAAIAPVAENLLNQFRDVFRIDGRELLLTASIGIAVYPDDGGNASELLRKADTAMYYSKELGRNIYSYFTDSMNRDVSRRLAIEEQLHGSLERDEFEVFYQVKMDVSSSCLVGCEALVRWDNPVLGRVPPDEFISIAEHTGFIVQLGKFVLQRALEQTVELQKEFGPDFTIAVNMSPRQFRDANLVEFIQQSIEKVGLDACSLELEITEGVLMSGYSHVEEILKQLTEMDISIAMDDFGTGYSSLSYLRSYPFNVLKVDRTFVRDITNDKADRELISASVVMAHSLGLKVVAEGVETQQQLEYLQQLNCDFAQGYLLGKPLPFKTFVQSLRQAG